MIIKFILLVLIILCLIVLNIKENFLSGCQRKKTGPSWYSLMKRDGTNKVENSSIPISVPRKGKKSQAELEIRTGSFCYRNRDSNCGSGCWNNKQKKKGEGRDHCDNVFECCQEKLASEGIESLEGSACKSVKA